MHNISEIAVYVLGGLYLFQIERLFTLSNRIAGLTAKVETLIHMRGK